MSRIFTFNYSPIIAWCLLSVCSNLAVADEWNVSKGKHFLVYFPKDKKYSEKVLYHAEKSYSRIVDDLGFTKHDDFWVWENRAKIFLYPDRKSFIGATGAPQWAVGKANYRKKEIDGIDGDDVFLASVLPHEIAHLVFRDFIGFGEDVPLWLDEGVAQWEDEGGREKARQTALLLYRSGRLMSIVSLASVNVENIAGTGRAVEFYAQSVSIVGFMIEEYGTERFTGFCRKLKEGSSVDDALRFTYRGRVSNIAELESKWINSLEVK